MKLSNECPHLHKTPVSPGQCAAQRHNVWELCSQEDEHSTTPQCRLLLDHEPPPGELWGSVQQQRELSCLYLWWEIRAPPHRLPYRYLYLFPGTIRVFDLPLLLSFITKRSECHCCKVIRFIRTKWGFGRIIVLRASAYNKIVRFSILMNTSDLAILWYLKARKFFPQKDGNFLNHLAFQNKHRTLS